MEVRVKQQNCTNGELFTPSVLEQRFLQMEQKSTITYHIGMGFFCDSNGALCIAPRKYIENFCDSYFHMFGQQPKQNMTLPVQRKDYAELHDSELLYEEWIQKYQSIIRALQWIFSISRFDVQNAVMTLSSFRVTPRRGHLDRVKRIYGYLYQMIHATIRIRTEEPDLYGLTFKEYAFQK